MKSLVWPIQYFMQVQCNSQWDIIHTHATQVQHSVRSLTSGYSNLSHSSPVTFHILAACIACVYTHTQTHKERERRRQAGRQMLMRFKWSFLLPFHCDFATLLSRADRKGNHGRRGGGLVPGDEACPSAVASPQVPLQKWHLWISCQGAVQAPGCTFRYMTLKSCYRS